MALLFASIYLLCVAAALGQQEGCVWDTNAEVNRGLDPASLNAGATYAAHLPEVREDERCREECCKRDDCQLALVGTPADGQSQCYLVSCLKEGKDVCVLVPSTQFRSYRKSSQSQEPETETRSSNFSSDDCRMQKAVGFCRAAFPRFYYDVTNQTCKPFIYGGCQGNNNNFKTLAECEAACSGVTGDVIVTQTLPKRRMAGPEKTKDTAPKAPLPKMTSDEFAAKCQAEPQVGPCRASMPRFYYRDGTCQQFTYGGCHGNQNNYVSEEECMKNCTVTVIDIDEDIKRYQEGCTVPYDTGLCRAAFPAFYFEASTQSCKRFIYGGCGGNKNRYATVEECMSQCAGKDGRYDEHGHNARARWTPAFFLVATLAVISVVLLVGLLLISSRRTRQQLTFTLDDKQELLPEEYPPAEEPPKPVLH
ncbi:kunitz-type protease inhibitor 2 [Salminus brasiliensis]|uniref:kunitz-type protease inhibitor 2 n=1 Tax=Salminus brasiliensis TaxID=930266 RepID=UPI003B830169